MGKIRVAAAQMGPVPSSIVGNIDAKKINELLVNGSAEQKKEGKQRLGNLNVENIRQFNFDRTVELLKVSARRNVDLVVFPELTLTSFFPYFWIEDDNLLSSFFEKNNLWKEKVYKKARELNIAIAFGYCQQEKCNFNIFDLYNPNEEKNYFYRKVHIPGFDKPRSGEETFQFEKKYFTPGSGYPVWDVSFKNKLKAKIGMIICHDRRYSNPYIMMGLRKVEIILNGYNTPFYLTFNHGLDGDVYKFHYFPLQAQAIMEGTFIVSVARAGDIFGHKQIAGSCIISPDGEIISKTEKLGEDIIYADLDLDWCKTVRGHKYQGERAEPRVLLNELKRYLHD